MHHERIIQQRDAGTLRRSQPHCNRWRHLHARRQRQRATTTAFYFHPTCRAWQARSIVSVIPAAAAAAAAAAATGNTTNKNMRRRRRWGT